VNCGWVLVLSIFDVSKDPPSHKKKGYTNCIPLHLCNMASSKKVVKGDDVNVELGDIYETPNDSTAQDDDLLPVTPEDREMLAKFYSDFDYVMVFPMMGEGQTPFNPKDPSSSEQVSVCLRSIHVLYVLPTLHSNIRYSNHFDSPHCL